MSLHSRLHSVIKLEPDWIAYNNRCWLIAMMSTPKLSDCETATNNIPESASALDSYAFAEAVLGKFDTAIALYKKLLRKQPYTPSALYGLGVSELAIKNEIGAKHLNDALSHWPEIDKQDFARRLHSNLQQN